MATTLNASLRMQLIDDVSPAARQIGARLAEVGRSSREAGLTGVSAMAGYGASVADARAEVQRLAAANDEAAASMRRVVVAGRQGAQSTSSSLVPLVQTARAQTQMASTATLAARASGGLTEASRAQGRAMAEHINLASELALGFGGLSPRLQQLAIGFAGAGNNAFALAGAFGPIGVVVGTLIGVLPGLISLFSDTSDELGEMRRGAGATQQTFEELISTIQRMRAENERERQRARGELDVEEQEAALGAQQNLLNRARGREREFRRGLRGSSRNGFADAVERIAGGQNLAGLPEAEQRRIVAEALRASVPEGQDASAFGTFGPTNFAGAVSAARDNALRLQRQQAATANQERAVAAARQALDDARARQQESQRREDVLEAPNRLRQQLEDELTVSGGRLTQRERSRLLDAATPGGRGLDREGRLLGRLGGRAGAFRDLSEQLRQAEIAAAQQRLEDARADALVSGEGSFGDGPAEPTEPATTRARRAVRRAPARTAAPSGEAGSDRLAAAVEGLEAASRSARRVEVDVRVSDDRVQVTTRDASAADITGGQQ